MSHKLESDGGSSGQHEGSGTDAGCHDSHEHSLTLSLPGTTHRQATTSIPDSVGDYRIVGVLGEGGMGVVYEAEQQQPRRRVAVKVMRQGHQVDELHTRMFQREAATLARLKHPNIAAIYESGHTDDGHDFFAMELVRGLTLDRWMQQRPSTITTDELALRLRLFRTICEAVHYAHQRGVIHRDLKPSNIVVTETKSSSSSGATTAAVPMVKILDFGLARITDQDVAATMASEIGIIKGTLPYMSPEQARGMPDEIDVRTDVYALGVILYEMLAGRRPYDTARSALVEAVRVICEDPPRPLRQAWHGSRRLDEDVETIVGKTLEKEPDRRYNSAAAVAEDIDRYLGSQPITARPPSAMYQLRKFAHRNRVLVGATISGALVLVAFAATMVIQAERIASERNRANQEARAARQVSDFLIGLFKASDPTGAQGEQITAREMLDAGSATIDDLIDQPRTQATFMETIARVYLILGVYDRAESLLDRALVIRESFADDEELELAACLKELADLQVICGRAEKGEKPAVRAVSIRERLLGDHPDLADSLNTLGNVQWHCERLDEAEATHRRALAIREALLDPQHPDIAQSLHNIGALRYFAGDYSGAEALYKRSISIEEAVHGPDDWNLATSLHTLAIVYQDQARYREALPLENRSLAIREKVFGPEHPHVALSLTTLGGILCELDRSAEAEPLIHRAVTIAEAAWGPQHPEVWWMRRGLARAMLSNKHLEEAEQLLRQLIETIESEGEEGSLPLNLNTLGEVLHRQGRLPEAVASYSRSITIVEGQDPDDPWLGLACSGLADVYADAGRFEQAATNYQRALRVMEAAWGREDHDYLRTAGAYAEMLRANGRDDQATAILGD